MPEEITITTYVALLNHSDFLTGETIGPATVRNARKEAKQVPGSAYAFYYFDIVRTYVEVNGDEVECASERLNRSKTYYIDAQVLDYHAVSDFPGDNRIVLHYVDGGGRKVIRCRTGNFVPYEPERDEFISGC